MQTILKKIRKADEDFHLLGKHDTVVVGVSGGKDSVLLLHALTYYQRFKHKSFTLIGVYLDFGFENMDISCVSEFCKKEKITFYIEKTNIYEILKHYPKKNKTLDCSRCSSLKRGAIINVAQKYGANKVAFAHHADDAIETLFLNAFYGAKLQTFQPKIHLDDKNIDFIRPLIYTEEKDIIKTVKHLHLPIVKSACPNDGLTKRQSVKTLLAEIEGNYKGSKQNLLNLLSNEDIRLWRKQ
ncbi:MAG: ATP-binding protein [Breznakia sp.]